MKLAFVYRHFNKEGGIQRYATEIAERFSKEHEVHIFANSRSNLERGKIIFHKVPIIKTKFLLEVSSFALFSTFIHNFYRFDLVINQGVAATFKQDILIAHSCHKAGVELRNKNKKYFMTKFDRFICGLERINYRPRKYKKIIAISNRVKQEIIEFYSVPDEDINVVYNGVNTESFSPHVISKYRNKLRDKYCISDYETVVLFIANRFKSKGLYYLIQAVAKLSQKNKLKLLVVGGDDQTFYLNYSKELGINDKLVFVGHSSDVCPYYAASDIFVLPTLYEAFGLVITEAMSCGLPVIVSKDAGASELIIDGYNGLLIENPKDPNEISSKINLFVQNNNFRNKLGSMALKTAEKYSWNHTYNEINKIFNELTS